MSSIFDNSEMKAKLIAKLKEFGYEYKRDLGGGGQGTCYEVMKIKDDIKSKVAVKITLKTDDHGYDRVNEYAFWNRHSVLRESGRMVQVRFYETFKIDNEDFRLIEMDIMKGTIGDLIKKGNKFSLYEIVYILNEVCKALVNLQKGNLYHGDIKPSNIFYGFVEGAENRIKLGDFGCSYSYNPDLTLSAFSSNNMFYTGTPAYNYPERGVHTVTGEKSRCATKAVDTYAVGVSLYQMLGGNLNDINDLDVKKNLDELERIFPSDDEDLKQIFLKACHPNPTKRFTKAKNMQEAFEEWFKKHPEEVFIASADKEDLFYKAIGLHRKVDKTAQEINEMKRYFMRSYDLNYDDAGYYLIRLHDKKVISLTNDYYNQICQRLINIKHKDFYHFYAKKCALNEDYDQAKALLASLIDYNQKKSYGNSVSLYNYALLCLSGDNAKEVHYAINTMEQLAENGFKPAIDFIKQLEK